MPEEQQERFFEAAGIENILCKSLGSNTPTNVVKATINGLKSMRTLSDIARLRNKTMLKPAYRSGGEMKLKVTQTRSTINRIESHKKIIKSLGLGKIGKSRIHNDTPSIRGMINKVAYLLKVEELKEEWRC